MPARSKILALVFVCLLAGAAFADPSPVFIKSWGSLGAGPGQFNHPFGIAIDASDFVYVADQQNERVQKFTANGDYVGEWTIPSGGPEPSDPTGICVAPNGDILVTEHHRHVVSRWTSGGSKIGEIGLLPGSDDPGHFVYPVGVATDPAGNIYVGDSGNNRIQKFASDGTFLAQWGVNGSGPGEFLTPYDVEWHDGSLWVSEYYGGRYQAFDADGNLVGQVGTPGIGDGQFNGCEGSAFIGSTMFACDTGQNRLQVFKNGAWSYTFGEIGTDPGEFYTPSDAAVNSKGELFVVEWNNHRVQKFGIPAEAPTPVAGTSWGHVKDRYRR